MSRRRSKDPTTDIRITIPRSVLDGIHDEIEPTASRSRWISDACRDKLLESGDKIADASSKQLAAALFNRGHITHNMYKMVVEFVKITERKATFSNPSEEV